MGFGSHLGGWTGLILVILVILLFAAPKLPTLAKSIAESLNIFKGEMGKKDKAEAREETTTESGTDTSSKP